MNWVLLYLSINLIAVYIERMRSKYWNMEPDDTIEFIASSIIIMNYIPFRILTFLMSKKGKEEQITEYKTFKDLKFEKWKSGSCAVMNFPNGYGIKVYLAKHYGVYSNGIDTYELWVLKDGEVYYGTSITNYALPYVSKTKITAVMKELQKLKG